MRTARLSTVSHTIPETLSTHPKPLPTMRTEWLTDATSLAGGNNYKLIFENKF